MDRKKMTRTKCQNENEVFFASLRGKSRGTEVKTMKKQGFSRLSGSGISTGSEKSG